MITQQLTNTSPYILNSGLATKTSATSVPNVPGLATNSICLCASGCEYVEPVFAKNGGEWYENDASSFLYQKLIAADTITLKLYKAGTELATITGATYGTDYPTFTAQPLYVGYQLDWEKVFNLHGAGWYEVKAEKVILGTSSTETSQKFRLLEYSDEAADGTTRIETYQTGNILSSSFNYSDLVVGGWYQSFRINGRLNSPDPKIETDRILDENYEQDQVNDQIYKEWILETKQLSSQIGNQILYDNSLANKYLVTDNNNTNYEVYRRQSLYVTGIEKLHENAGNKQRSWKLTLSDKIQNIIKRNF
jgi:hypothetical protein